MVALILALLYGMKAVVVVNDQRVQSSFARWLAFTVGWLGMRPGVFRRMADAPLPGAARLMRKGAARFAVGLALYVMAYVLWNFAIGQPGVLRIMIVLGLLLPALSLMLHFGFLNVLTGYWRWRGAPVANLFHAPFRARTLSDFWGRRWNIAFAEMSAIAVYRPLRQRFGNGVGRLGAFVFSGLAHELAISAPVQAGYGLPTLYFGLQALGQHLEKRYQLGGQLWTAVWVLAPTPILFHTDFLVEIVLPLLHF